jgi:hypothetical protein
MSCERHRSVLTDVALGAPAPPALASHLAECDACRTALDAEQEFMERLDAEVEDSLHLQPSVGLLPRVRQRVAEPRRARGRWLVAWLVPATLGLLLVSRILIRKPTGAVAPAPPQRAATEPRPLPPAQSGPAPTSTRTRPLAAGRIARSERIASGSEVIIPAAEREALRRYMRDLQARRIDSVPLRMVGVEPSGLRRIEMPPIDLAPIRIAIIGVQPLTMDSPNLGVNE